MDKDIKFAFKKSIPVMFGYLFLGSAIGIMLQEKVTELYGHCWQDLPYMQVQESFY